MKVLVCGSRHFNDYSRLSQTLESMVRPEWKTIIHGGAKGADSLGGLWGEANKFEVEVYPADWNTHGKAAGPVRNIRMLKEGKPDFVVAFLAPNSRGTKHMISIAQEAGVPVKVIEIVNET